MLSKSQINFVKLLHQKKNRKEAGLFIVEGDKSIAEFTHSTYIIDTIFYTAKSALKLGILSQNVKLFEIKDADLQKISTLNTPQQALAIVRIPENKPDNTFKLLNDTFTLVLDTIQDPGNLGTIIRTADWFGFKQIICSLETVEAYNPKVVQASMGSLARMQVNYTDLTILLQNCNLPIYGALLDGKSIYEINFPPAGLLVLGNEGNGITDAVRKLVTHSAAIPRFGMAESLNVAVSAAIFCMEIKKSSVNNK